MDVIVEVQEDRMNFISPALESKSTVVISAQSLAFRELFVRKPEFSIFIEVGSVMLII